MKQSTPIAVALEFDGENTPVVNARGIGPIADKIIEIAKQHGVPLQQDNELVEILSDLSLGDEIPEDLYRVIAEIIAFAYILSGKFPKNWSQ
ncbi:MAG: EscU/YscU/HrcU family type III secretion system export apparatus switch protein [Gammaproteobacteria bacterium]|nr:EscU/YscU/HrcU family type III secretion system export apparatus switch protein [Gammaproteobacteria bacterium]